MSEQRCLDNVPSSIYLDTHSPANPYFIFHLLTEMWTQNVFHFPSHSAVTKAVAPAWVRSGAGKVVGSGGDCGKPSPHPVRGGFDSIPGHSFHMAWIGNCQII